MKLIVALFLVSLIPALSSCSTAPGQPSVTIPAPHSYADTMIYGYRTNALVRRSAASALNAKLISKSDAQQVLDTTNTVRTALDEARKLGCPAMTKEPQDGDKAACLENIPDTTIGKLKFAVGLADSALVYLKTLGAVK